MTPAKKQWLWMLPIMLIGFYPMLRMSLFKADYSQHLLVKDTGRSLTPSAQAEREWFPFS